jgi:hypothetical protein
MDGQRAVAACDGEALQLLDFDSHERMMRATDVAKRADRHHVVVLLMMGRDIRAMWPGEPLFWVVMSLGVTAGFAVAYPVNVWLVAQGLKRGLMTERGGVGGIAPGHGERAHNHNMGGMDNAGMPMDGESVKPFGPTRPQLVTLTVFTLLMLVVGMTLPSAFVNVRLSAHDVRGVIMPRA